MRKNKLLAGILAAALVVTSFPATLLPADKAKADAVTPVETTITKTQVSNPIVPSDSSVTLPYGGDPSVLVEGDTVYLYTGRDSSKSEGYYMLDWQCYSTKDLKTWKNEGVIMDASKNSITWANTGTDAWAGQIEKYNGKYYFYYCTWDSTSSGQQSIGVAVSDSPTGPFKDKGEPLVKGTTTSNTSGSWSTFNDIDPTVWVEEGADGVEHRYLCWGNNKLFICELDEDMISVKDVNGDGKITFGVQSSGSTPDADIIEKNVTGMNFTEAPWIYRRKDADGKPYGKYYIFYARNWREEMAYATTDDLMNGTLTYGGQLMPPTATSNTNHPAVFDFKGKTYFVYHNGSLPGGSGFRRTPCIAELHFNEDGSIPPIPESPIGIYENEPYTLYNNGCLISHSKFTNSSEDAQYPYTDIKVGNFVNPDDEDAEWAIVDGKSVPSDGNKEAYVSIQSNNKAGLYLTVNDNSIVTLAQDAKYNTDSGSIAADENTAKAQTFHTVKGLDGTDGTISFESVYKPGNYLTLSGGQLVLTDGSNAAAATFTLNGTAASPVTGSGVDASIESLTAENYEVAKKDDNYSMTVPFDVKTVKVSYKLTDKLAYAIVDGTRLLSTDTVYIPLSGKVTAKTITVYAADGKTNKDYTITISKTAPTNSAPVYNTELFKTFTFDDDTNGAIAVTKATVPATVTDPSYSYVEGKSGKAIHLTGSYGLKLCDAAGLGKNYSISYWMKPDKVKTNVDPTLAAGLFSPEYWLNLTFGRAIWSKANGTYIDDAGTVSYKENEWQHVTLTVEGSSAKLYVNGEMTNQGTIASDIMSQNGAAIYFGVNAWDAYFEGVLDEVAIFNRVLSADEIQSIAYEATNVTEIITNKDPNASTNNPPQSPTPTPPASPSPVPSPSVDTATVNKVTVKAANQKPGTKTVYLKKGGKVTLSATVTGTGKFSKTVTWKSSKTKVATVSSKGVVKAKAAGTAKITVTSKANTAKKATITVKVSKKAVKNKKLKLKVTKKSLKKGKTYTVGIKSMTSKTTDAVTYKSSKKSVASVDKFGVVTAKKKGKATITVKCGKKSAKLAITVK